MELGEIFSDALVYPFNNIKALVIYLVLGIILGIAVSGTVAAMASGVAVNNLWAVIGSGVIGFIVALVLGFMITGYELDIIKYGIERSSRGPEIDFIRQFFNGVKVFVVQIVYMIIPIIIAAIMAIIFQHWLSTIINFIVSVIFGLALMMAQCRLAKTEDLSDALAIGEAIGDISNVGIVNLLIFIIAIALISVVLLFICGLIAQWNSIVGGILIGIVVIYLVFFGGRALGLLYSNV
jgi:hypothetical protein